MPEQSDYVTLVSSDGFAFVVQRSSACISPAIKNMLDPSSTIIAKFSSSIECILMFAEGFLEATLNTCHLDNIRWASRSLSWRPTFANLLRSGLVLEKVCEYFYYYEKNKDAKDVPDMDIPSELCLELCMYPSVNMSDTCIITSGEALYCKSNIRSPHFHLERFWPVGALHWKRRKCSSLSPFPTPAPTRPSHILHISVDMLTLNYHSNGS